ncbi:MAG: ribonuclease J [Acidobacteria bacterium]|nr:ribonuclease J [Acidobacteriota bacterium]
MAEGVLQVVPLGGLGEFGMNCMALRYQDDIVVIDCGMMFPDAELMGIDSVIPDFTFLKDRKEMVRGLVLTHGHEDHIGGVPYLLSEFDIPVYGTDLTLGLVERRLEEHHLADSADLNVVKPSDKITLGPFSIEFIQVTHSIVSAVALAITTPLGVVIHTGDFKVDPTPTDEKLFDLHKLAEYGKRGVLLLLSDSTNSDTSGYSASERAVRPGLENVFHRAEHRIVVACFSSSIPRIQQLLDVSREFGRKLCFIGRSMTQVTEIAHNLGLLRIPEGSLLRPQDVQSAPRNKVCVVVSGTQGEPMSAMSRMAVDNHRNLSLESGDTFVLSARMIPGNEKAIYRMLNHVAKRGAILPTPGNPPLHVSGHAYAEELRLVLNLVRPRFFMPVHGEYRQMAAHAKLAQHLKSSGLEQVFVLETGATLELDKRGAQKSEEVSVGRVLIDSGSLDDVVDEIVVRDRRHLATDGFVLPIVAINKRTGKTEATAEIVTRGFISDNGAELLVQAKQVVARTLENSSVEERGDFGVIQEKIRVDLKKFLNKQTQRRPLILPVILEA